MSTLASFIHMIAKHGNAAFITVSDYDNLNYVYEITNDPAEPFKIMVYEFDKPYFDGTNIDKSAKLISSHVVVSGYDIELLYSILSVVLDNSLMENSEEALIVFQETNEENVVLADQMLEASYNALSMSNYELVKLSSMDYEEMLGFYLDTMCFYSDGFDTNLGNFDIPSQDDILTDLYGLDGVIDYTRSEFNNILEYIDKIQTTSEPEERMFYAKNLDTYCGGEDRITVSRKQISKTRVN